jgi:hypothetical protein
LNLIGHLLRAATKERGSHLHQQKRGGHTYTPDNGGAVRLVAAEEMKQSKSVGMLERELGA